MINVLSASQRRALRGWREKIWRVVSGSYPFLLFVLLTINGCSTVESPASLEGPSPVRDPAEELETFQT
jgi:hypothetical protein